MKPNSMAAPDSAIVETLADHVEAMVALARNLPGHLTDADVRWLALAGATLDPSLGTVLEIGSYLGKSTVVLARSVRFAGGRRIVAVDPLILDAATDPFDAAPATLSDRLEATLRREGVAEDVEFHQLRSDELARYWQEPVRLLWIDGDHSLDAAAVDFALFREHLRPGAIVAFHDVLNPFEGPLRVFCDSVLAAPDFGACGLCGSIGWARRTGPAGATAAERSQKTRLYRRLALLRPLVRGGRRTGRPGRRCFRLARRLVSRNRPDVSAWLRMQGARA